MQPVFSCQNKVNADLNESMLTLYVEVGQYHLSYYIVHNNEDFFTDYELFNSADRIHADTVVEFFKNTKVFQKKYSKVIIIHHAHESALIPQTIFIPGTEAKIIELLHGDAVEYTFLSDALSHSEIINIYAIDTKIITVCNDIFSGVTHTHINSILLKNNDYRDNEPAQEIIDLIFYPSSFHMTVLKGKELQIMQAYYFETKDDLSYYILSAIDNFGLNPLTLKLNICGFIKNDSVLMSSIRQLVSDVESLNPPVTMSIPLDLNVPIHYFTPIFISTQCESSVEN